MDKQNVVEMPEKLEQRIKYIHENPIELQLVGHERHWINSCYRAYTDETYLSNIKLAVLYR